MDSPFDQEPARSSPDEIAATNHAITQALRGLIIPAGSAGGTITPPDYVRRHLVEHAAEAGVLDSTVLTPEFLPYVDSERLHAVAPLASTDRKTAEALSLWRLSRHTWSFDDPAANQATLAFAAHAMGNPALPRPASPQWHILAAHWPTGSETLTANGVSIRHVAMAVRDGTPVAVTSGTSGQIRVWDLTTGRPSGRWQRRCGSAVSALSTIESNGLPVIAAATEDGLLVAWDLTTGTRLHQVKVGPVRAMVLTRFADLVAATVLDMSGGLRTHLLGTRDGIWEPPSTGMSLSALAVVSPETGGHLVAGGMSGELMVVSPFRKVLRTASAARRAIRGLCVATGADGSVVLSSAAGSRRVTAHRVLDLSPLGEVELPEPVATLVSAGGLVFAGSTRGSITVLDAEDIRPITRLYGHTREVTGMASAVVNDRPVLVSTGRGRHLRIWDLSAADAVDPDSEAAQVGPTDSVTMLPAVTITCGRDGVARGWGTDGRLISTTLPLRRHANRAVTAATVDGRVVLAYRDPSSYVHLHDFSADEPIRSVGIRASAIAAGALDGRPVLFSVSERTLFAVDLSTGEVQEITSFGEPILTMASSPELLVAGGNRGGLYSVNVHAGTAAQPAAPRHGGPVRAIALTKIAGEPHCVSVSGSSGVRVDRAYPASAPPPSTIVPARLVHAIACTELGGRPVLYTGTSTGRLASWDLNTGRSAGSGMGVPGAITALACSTTNGRTTIALAGAGISFVRYGDPEQRGAPERDGQGHPLGRSLHE